MRSIRNRLKLGEESGYTIVELITAAALTALLVGTFGVLIVNTGRNQPAIAEHSSQVDQGRVAVEKITRDIREAYAVVGTPTSNQLSINTYVRSQTCGSSVQLASDQASIACRVTFSCTTTACTRTEATTTGTSPGSPVTVADGLLNAGVFTYTPSTSDPSHVTVTLRFPADDGSEAVTVSDGAEMRNDA